MDFPNLSLGVIARGAAVYILNPGDEAHGEVIQKRYDLENPPSRLSNPLPTTSQPAILNVQTLANSDSSARTRAQNFVSQTGSNGRWNVCSTLGCLLKGVATGAKVITRELTAAAVFGGITAGSAAATAAVGNSVLIASHHDGYDVNKGMFASLVGSAVFGGSIYLILRAAIACGASVKFDSASLDSGFDILGSMTTAAVGNAILQDYGVSTLSTRNAAVSAGAGAAIITGGLMVVGCAAAPIAARVAHHQHYSF